MSDLPPRPSPFANVIARESISDSEVTALLTAMVRRERVTLAAMLGYLGQVVERKLYAPAGYDCVSNYLVDRFGWSLPSAQKRLQAAGLCRRFPELLDLVATGAFNLTGLCVLAPVVTAKNVDRVCVEAQGLTRVQLSEYVRRLRAESDPDALTRRDREPAWQMTLEIDLAPPPSTSGATEMAAMAEPKVPATPVARPPMALHFVTPPPVPPTPWTSRLTVHATNALRAKLRQAKALLSHVRGVRSSAEVIDRALDVLIATELKRRYGSTKRATRKSTAPKATPATAATRKTTVSTSERQQRREYIPVKTRHEVHVRDEGRCTFAGDDGHVCGSDYLLQFHHRIPWAKGGPNTPENLTLHCFTHNQHEAEREGFGGRRGVLSGVQQRVP